MEENQNVEELKTPEEILLEMKKNTVPKEDFDALTAKYNSLFQAVANGITPEGEKTEETEEEKREKIKQSILDIHSKTKRGTVEQFKNMIEMHDYLTSHGQRSCFAPSKGEITESTEAQCEALRDLMAEAVEASNGDNVACGTYFASRLDFSGVK